MQTNTKKTNLLKLVRPLVALATTVAFTIPIMYYRDSMDRAVNKLNKIERIKMEERLRGLETYCILYGQVFGNNGLADVNADGRISFIEKVDAYERANSLSHWSGHISFHEPSIEGLKKAIESYESERSILGEK